MRTPEDGKKVGKKVGNMLPPSSTLAVVLASSLGQGCSQFLAGNRKEHEACIITTRRHEADARFRDVWIFWVGGALMRKPRSVPESRDLDDWQVAETLAALEEARAGDFAAEEDVRAVHEKWAMSGRLALDRLADDRERELDSGGAEAVPVEDAIARLEARFRRQP